MKASTKVIMGIIVLVVAGLFVSRLTGNDNLVPGSVEEVNIGATIDFESQDVQAVSKIVEKGADENGDYFITEDYPNSLIRFEEINYITANVGIYDDFAQCLTDSGTKMYGAYWCPHCDTQKKMFGSSFDFAPYVECDARGNNADPAACQAAGIEGYPTWIFPDGERRSGETPLRTLAALSGCELPS